MTTEGLRVYRSLLVPLDGSTVAEHALDAAVGIARQSAATLTIVRVWDRLAHLHGMELVGRPDVGKEPEHAMAQAYLDGVAHRVEANSRIPVKTMLLEGGVAWAIQEYARTSGADLVIMTTHGRTGVSRAWLGSVADSLLRQLPIPVLLWRRPAEPRPGANDGAFARVLIPLDGSHEAEQIVPLAKQLGELGVTSYTLLRIVRPVVKPENPESFISPGWRTDSEETQAVVSRAKEYLAKVARRLRNGHGAGNAQMDSSEHGTVHGHAKVETHVIVDDNPAATILSQVSITGADLIALTTHSQRVIRIFFGSVADKVIRGSECPLLLFHPMPD